MKKRLLFSTVILIGLALAGGAWGQAPSQADSQSPAKTKKAPKVWTDDNIGSVRTPADDYMVEQQNEKDAQQQAAAKQAADQKAAAAAATAPAWPQPKTVQEADQMLAQKQHFLSSEQGMVQELQKQLNDPTVNGFQRTRLEWRLKSHTVTMQDAKTNVQQLESEKEALEKKAAADKNSASSDKNTSSPGGPDSTQN